MSGLAFGGCYLMNTMTDDVELLRQYAICGSDSAFGELVRRHIDLVYTTALRQTAGDTHLAQDVTQSVFTDLARKARSLSRRVVLTGWLYQATRFAAAKAVRTERRRVNREQEAVAMQDHAPESQTEWEQLQPFLDEAMDSLPAQDRDAVLLRFFQRKELREVGVALGTTEEAARKRVTRAVEKLRGHFARRGVVLSSAGLIGALTAGALQTAPAALSAAVATAAIAGAATTTGLTLTLINFMSMTKLQIAAAGVLLVAGVATPLALQQKSLRNLREENRTLSQQVGQVEQLRTENEQLSKLKTDADELARLRSQMSDLLQLRSEVTRLRNEKAAAEQLKTENTKLRQAVEQMASAQRSQRLESQQTDEARQQALERLNNTKQLALALHMFANDNGGRLPQRFAETRAYLPGDSPLAQISETQFEIVYFGKLTDITNVSNAILIREKQPRIASDGSQNKAYAFADGHAEIHKMTDGGFDEWEKAHQAMPRLNR